MAPTETGVRTRARAPNKPAILAAFISGASLTEIATNESLTLKRVEKIISQELRKRWIVPAQDYAKLQIARLEAIAAKLKAKAGRGDLPTIDRLLRVLDRLDRYHGFNKLAALGSAEVRDMRPALLARMKQLTRVRTPEA